MCIFKFSKKHHLVCFLSLLNYGDIGSVLIKHLQIVIPLSYPCYYTNLCPHKPHNPHTHTHTHTHHTHTHHHTHHRHNTHTPPPFYWIALGRMINLLLLISLPEPREWPRGHIESVCMYVREVEEQRVTWEWRQVKDILCMRCTGMRRQWRR